MSNVTDADQPSIDDNTIVRLRWGDDTCRRLSEIEEMDPDTITPALVCEGLLLQTIRAYDVGGLQPTVGDVRRNLKHEVGEIDWPSWRQTMDEVVQNAI